MDRGWEAQDETVQRTQELIKPTYPSVRKPRLSVTIVAQDEERTIGSVLAAVRGLADEIIFVDSGSTDATIDIATSYGVKYFHQDWLGYSGQKNYAIDLASGDWILSLDADEILTPELVTEIRDLLESAIPPEIAGFSIPRILYIGQTAVKHGGFYPDAQLRLIRRDRGRFRSRIVHESIKVEGETRQLKHPMLHYAYKDVDQFAVTMDKYARMSAQHYFHQEFKPWRAHPLNELLHPAWTFVYRYFLRAGFLDGSLCWRLNVIYADYVRKKIKYLRELVKQSKDKRIDG
jgi:glycosyltransferase involved in cell wall biosynthesis